MSSILYGVGIGPGDPELLTLKAKRILDKAEVIAFPGEIPEETIAYRIISKLIDLSEKQLTGLSFPMTKDKKQLSESHRRGALKIKEILDEGKDVAFPTLGDPTVYSTYMYINSIISDMGYKTEIIPGVTSFCAAAARINEPLTENDDELHIIPSSYGVTDALKLSGTKVLMKSGKSFSSVFEEAGKTGQKLWVLENVGMENERIYSDPEYEKTPGYYTLVIVKER